MRKILPLSLIVFAFNVHSQTLQESRGFGVGKCYQELMQLSCREGKTCELLAFPRMQGQVAFLVQNAPKEMKDNSAAFFDVTFKMKDQNSVEILSSKMKLSAEALEQLQKSSYLGDAIPCISRSNK